MLREPLSSVYDKAILDLVTLWGAEGPRSWVTERPGPPSVSVLTTGTVVHAQSRARRHSKQFDPNNNKKILTNKLG